MQHFVVLKSYKQQLYLKHLIFETLTFCHKESYRRLLSGEEYTIPPLLMSSTTYRTEGDHGPCATIETDKEMQCKVNTSVHRMIAANLESLTNNIRTLSAEETSVAYKGAREK